MVNYRNNEFNLSGLQEDISARSICVLDYHIIIIIITTTTTTII